VTVTQRLIPDPELQPVLDLWPDTGEILGLGRSLTYAAAARNEIPTVRIGRRIVVPVARLRAMLGMDESGGASAVAGWQGPEARDSPEAA